MALVLVVDDDAAVREYVGDILRIEAEVPLRLKEYLERLDLGPGGYSRAPSTETRRGVATALRKKLGK